MWWKKKFILFGLCMELILLTFFTFDRGVRAAGNPSDGFIIEADRVVGTGMTASIVKQETSSKDAQPMLRIQYKSATIYGMKLTKEVESPSGPLSITLKAKGPVTVMNMTVDTTAISFKGACVKASEMVPEAGMENVVMVAHFMNSGDSAIQNLTLNTVSGDTKPPRPGKLQILQDLAGLPINQLDKEIEKISSGHLPLTCVDTTQGKSDPISSITDPIKDIVDVVTKPLDPVLKPLDPVLKPLDPVLKPLDPVLKPIEPVLKPLDPVLKPLEPVLKPVVPVVNSVNPVVSGAAGTVEKTVQSACSKLKDANGVITKELALNLIDEAQTKNLSLTTVCQSDTGLTSELQKWEGSLLKSLGLVDLLGKIIPLDPKEELTKIRDKVVKEPDGAILFKP